MVSLRPELDDDDNQYSYGSDDHKLPPIVHEYEMEIL